MDFRETFREVWAGCVYMVHTWRGDETDAAARRLAVMEDALGRSRVKAKADGGGQRDLGAASEKFGDPGSVRVDVVREVMVDGERQWLGVGDDYGYGLDYARRDPSAGLVDQFDLELEKRGYPRQGMRTSPLYFQRST